MPDDAVRLRAGQTLRRVPDDAVHTLTEWTIILRLRKHCLPREAREGRLRVARRAGTNWSTGLWIKQWLETGEVRRPAAPTAEGGPGG
jgi:hypothetical protein